MSSTTGIGHDLRGRVAVRDLYRSLRYSATATTPIKTASNQYFFDVPGSTGTVPLSVAASGRATVLLRSTGTVPILIRVGAGSPKQTTGTLPLTLTLSSRVQRLLTTTGTAPLTLALSAAAEVADTTSGEVGVAVPVTALQRTFLNAWDADRTGAPMLIVEGPEASVLTYTLEPTVPPNVTGRYLMRNSITLTSAPAGGGEARLTAANATVTEEPWGVVQVIVGGRDVTYFRGVPTKVDSYSLALPFGDQTAQVAFPGITPFDVPGTGDLSWLKEGASLDIVIKRLDDGFRFRRFEGYLISQDTGHDQSSFTNTWQAVGALMQAGQARHRVPTILNSTDIGTLVPKALNDIVSRRYPAIHAVTTGIMTTAKGSSDDTALSYAQNLLATAWTDSTDQWTIKRGYGPRIYRMALKSSITNHWNVYVGAPGVTVDLTRDLTETVNVIYGRGVATTGYAWAGWQYPGLHGDNAPAYPFSSAGSVMSIGTTDASTSSGSGVSDWQQRMHDLGYKITVDGVYSSADADAARDVQADKGLTVDGIVGPQTWDATFAVGSNAGSLTGAYRKPIAIDTRVDPYLYAADGAITGHNPAYDPTRLRFERDIDYGSGVSRADATRSARIDLARDKDPAWVGRVTLTTDPVEGSRWTIEEGHLLTIKGFQQGDVTARVVKADFDLNGGTVSLDVDTKHRDAMTWIAIRQRNQESKKQPARKPGNTQARSALANDVAVEFDGESKAGIIPRHALYGGLWTVLRIPVSEVGNIAKIDMTSNGPATSFCIALFGEEVTPAQLVHHVGNPLASDNPFSQSTAQAATLDGMGFIEAWGQKGQACGYWPKGQGDTGATVTGRFVDTGGVSYISAKPPWVWVAEYASSSTFMTGRIYPAPIQ